MIYDEKFTLSNLPSKRILYAKLPKNSEWVTWFTKDNNPRNIEGNNLFQYESTVENIASSIIVHEWYSHRMKKVQDDYKSHRLAYKNIINYKPLWNYTTDKYKSHILKNLLYYTYIETGRKKVDPKYRNLYNRYVRNKQ